MNKFSFNNEGNFNIGIITSPISQSGCIPTSQLLDIIRGISKNVCLITGNYGYEYFLKDHRIKTYGIYYRNRKNTFFRVCKYIQAQLQISSLLIKASKNVEIWIFFIGGDSLVFPMAVAKLLGKKVILSFASSSAQTHAASKDDLSIILKFLSNFNCRLTDCIVLYSESLINEWDLKKYQNKIIIAPRHFLDFNNYKMNEEIQRNNNLVGYIGRLSREKGVMNFVESIPIILKENPNLEFILIGDGALKKEIELYIEKNNLQHKVKVKGWVQHEKIPDCLNKLKLLILPSYTAVSYTHLTLPT
ncbi:glycosyltransferase, partial [Methanosarcina sp. 2.H.T.1A.15]|uniref:glycosyltransferase n=1 Tax=Methanosarcina sp. 2.H.T.1A.15 TaxID=1483596 RepID=UPI000622438A